MHNQKEHLSEILSFFPYHSSSTINAITTTMALFLCQTEIFIKIDRYAAVLCVCLHFVHKILKLCSLFFFSLEYNSNLNLTLFLICSILRLKRVIRSEWTHEYCPWLLLFFWDTSIWRVAIVRTHFSHSAFYVRPRLCIHIENEKSYILLLTGPFKTSGNHLTNDSDIYK